MNCRRDRQGESSTLSDVQPAPGTIRRTCGRLWRLILNNRLAIAITSLLWLIYRSGTQPRRLAYPCQQVAAVNVGAFAAGLIPALWLWRKPKCPVSRRVMIRRQILAALILFVVGVVGIETYQYAQTAEPDEPPIISARTTPSIPTTVGIHRQAPAGASYTTAEIESMVRQAVSLAGGLSSLITDKNSDGTIKVAIKVNLVQSKWSGTSGVVTDPRVCAAVVKIVEELGAHQVTIVEGSGDGDGRNTTWTAFRNAGYDTNSDRLFDYDTSVPLFDLNDSGGTDQYDPTKVTLVTIPNGVIRTQYWVPKILLDCDAFISVPTFKNHFNGTVTFAMKNRVGCAPADIYHYPGLTYTKWALVHTTAGGFPCTVAPCPSSSNENEIVQRTIVDLNLIRPNDFAIVDALIGITNGPNTDPPTYANPRMQMIVAGQDSLAVDTVCTLGMGYDPDPIGHIWRAHETGVLGTKDRGYITVRGNHVASVRSSSFPGNYAGSVLAETTPPAFTGLTPGEGATVSGNVTVTGSGISADVVRAELSVRMNDGPNLLTNGDFETGSTGWNVWQADWSSGVARDFNNTEPGRLGAKCLRLSATEGSFGVYQQVSVTPGKTYKLDALWKGKKVGLWNWYEIILIDGPFSMAEADQDPGVRNNYMYAYDKNTYGLDRLTAIQTPGYFGWVWAHDQNSPPDNRVDWNNRKGLRTATGNIMTVVLKCGSCCGTTGPNAWFDNVSLVEAGVPEAIVATLPSSTNPSAPTSPFSLVWNSAGYPPGAYTLKTTVYDAALNETSISRNVTLVSGQSPVISLQPTALTSSIIVGSNPNSGSFTVDNTGTGMLDYTVQVDQPWLSLNSYGGSIGAADPPHQIAVLYNCSGLPVGQHNATITVNGAGADNTPQTVAVTVNVSPEPLEVDFSASPRSGPAPLAVQFTDLSGLVGANKWQWDFGDGQTSDQRNPLHSYASEGLFTIRLTVTGSTKTQTAEKTDYIFVSDPPKVAFIGGDLDSGEPWPPASDVQIMQYMQSKGLVVSSYKDVPAERPSASAIAAGHDLVIASSSVTSGDIAGEFRYQSVPFVFWEPSLAINGREGLCDGPSTITSQTQINVTNNTHPIMAGVSTGNITVLGSSGTLSYCSGTKASGAQVLATVVGNTNQRVVMAAEPGAQLLDGGTAAGKRAMLYLYDLTWTQTNGTGKKILDNTLVWALGSMDANFSAATTSGSAPLTVQFTDQSTGPITLWTWVFGDGGGSKVRQAAHTYTVPGTYAVTLTVSGPVGQPDTLQRTAYIVVTPHFADLDADGDVDQDDLDLFEGCATGAGIAGPPVSGCTSNEFSSADMDNDNDVDQADFGLFQRCMTAPGISPTGQCAD